jgi:hypothetical protein
MTSTDIYISPHLDDVCFSLAATATQRQGGHLLNVFTLSKHISASARLRHRAGLTAAEIGRMRTQEDEAFAAQCKLARHDLGYGETSLLGLRHGDLTDIESDAALVEERLVGLLLDLADKEGMRNGTLFCPMGIGGHRNHLAVLMAVLQSLSRLRPRFRILFYEDLHYASNRQTRTDGIARFCRLANTSTPQHFIVPLAPGQFADKMKLVALYASQLERQPPVAGYFTPGNVDVPGPHEAFWAID